MSYKITINCLKFSPAVLFLLLFQPCVAQVNKKNAKEIGAAKFEYLDALVKKDQKSLGNDLVVMVWTDTMVYKTELGEFDSKTFAPIGSSSKWLTAALVMKMVEQGKISLDDKISQYLPVYESYGKGYITIRHCLSNFTGIQSESGMFSRKKFKTLEEEVESFAKKEIKANAGTEFRYSDMGLSIAGRILEIVSKKKFDMLIKQQLFNPLAMRKTSFSKLDGSAIDPSNGAESSADEFMHFLQMLLNNGKYNGQQVLTEESVNELRKIHATTSEIKYAPKSAQGFGYALGSWSIGEGLDGKATILANPSMSGTWPMVDWCRGYAALVFVKSPMKDEPEKTTYLLIRDAIDEKLPAKCK